jgi:hypothetical protein
MKVLRFLILIIIILFSSCVKYQIEIKKNKNININSIKIDKHNNYLKLKFTLQNISNDTLWICESEDFRFQSSFNNFDSQEFEISIDKLIRKIDIKRGYYKPPKGWHLDDIKIKYIRLLAKQITNYELKISFPLYENSILAKNYNKKMDIDEFKIINIFIEYFKESDNKYKKYITSNDRDQLIADNNYMHLIKQDKLVITILKKYNL